MKVSVFPLGSWCLTSGAAACYAVLMLAAGQAHAQTVYRVQGPDGRVTFSDKPPVAAASAVGTVAKTGAAPEAPLPYELRQVASKYPVTLYTSSNCAPCASGRALLMSRGVPFVEKTVTTPEDADSLKRLSGETSLPFMTLGGQQIKGFSDAEWIQYLNAAGYPATSVLPASYRRAAPSPLVVIQKQVPAAPEAELTQGAPAAAPRAPVDPNANPAGIKF